MADKKEKAERRHPSNIPRMVESKDVETVRNAIRDAYGFQVTEQYANDFIAFVEKAMRGDYVGS